MNTQQPQRYILVAVSGNTPQIVTETLFALMVKNKPSVQITEVYILTTEKGRQIAWLGLGGADGAIARFCHDYSIKPAIKFPYDNIYVFERDGALLTDIRTSQDNQVLQSQMLGFIKTLTEDDNLALHCSMGGGRRTMSAYMMLALTIYGRKQDSLTHVLVNEEFETNPDFFFPPKKNKKLAVRGANGKLTVVDTKNHKIELAEIPFVRLRKLYGANINDLEADIEKLVELAQVEIEKTPPAPETLQIDFKLKRADFGSQKVELRGVLLSLFVYFAIRKKLCAHPDGGCLACYQAPHEINIDSFIEIHRRLKGRNEDQEKTWHKRGLSFLSYRNRINNMVKEIDSVLEIVKEDKNGAAYGLKLDKERIKIVE